MRGRSIVLIPVAVDFIVEVVRGVVAEVHSPSWVYAPGYRPDRQGD